MLCWQCDEPSRGICNFCGRGVCKMHAKRNPYIMAAYDEAGDHPKVLMVDNALWCGECKPLAQAVDIPEIEGNERAQE